MDIWKFQKNEDGTSIGWNDPGLQHFRDDRIKNLAKETIQNSTDNPGEGNGPVRVVFSLEEHCRNEIPGIDSLSGAIEDCRLNMAGETTSSKREIASAISFVRAEKIKVLTISDYGTSGMGKKFYTFLKTMGASDDDPNRTGSHGMGKNAPLATSALRTIIVSSTWKDEESGNLKDAAQGRTVLMGRKTPDGLTYKNEGFWGREFDPLKANEHNYPWINRAPESIGTSIHVIGFQSNNSHWANELIAAAITTYFASFAQGKLILEVNDRSKSYVVDKDSIDEWFNKKWHTHLSQEEDQLALKNAYLYYSLLVAPEDQKIVREFGIAHLGKCRLTMRVSENEELPKKICVLRNGINITDSLSSFYKQPPQSLMEFVGIFECLTKDGRDLIRRMEPPNHNEIKVQQLAIDDQETGLAVLKELGKTLKDLVKEHARYRDNDETQIDALSEYLQDVDEEGTASIETDPNGNWGVPSPKPLPKPKKSPKLNPESGTDNTGPENTGPERKGKPKPIPITPPEPTTGDGSGNAPTPREVNEPIKLSQLRVIKTHDKKVKLFFSSQVTQDNCYIQLREMGSDSIESIGIVESDLGYCANGMVTLDVKQNQRLELNVELERSLLGAAEIYVCREVLIEEAE